MSKLLILGDSKISGYKVEQSFSKIYCQNKKYLLIDDTKVGYKTPDILMNLFKYNFAEIDKLWLCIGTNDIIYNHEPMIIFRRILDVLKEFKLCERYVFTLPNLTKLPFGIESTFKKEDLDKLNNKIGVLNELIYMGESRQGYSIIRLDEIINDKKFYQNDGNHLNQNAHNIIADKLINNIF